MPLAAAAGPKAGQKAPFGLIVPNQAPSQAPLYPHPLHVRLCLLGRRHQRRLQRGDRLGVPRLAFLPRPLRGILLRLSIPLGDPLALLRVRSVPFRRGL